MTPYAGRALAAWGLLLLAACGPTTAESDRAPGAGGGARAQDGPSPALTLRVEAPSSGRCAAPTPALVRSRDVALEGRITSADGGTVTVEAVRWYTADQDGTVTVDASGMPAEAGTFPDRVGQRVLVAALDGRVTLCGMSGAWSPTLACTYERAFG